MKIPLGKITEQQALLSQHPLLNAGIIQDIRGIQVFMESHVFAVWDFMSLIKSLQHHVCPSTTCWVPNQGIRSGVARLINEIVLCEETDLDLDGHSSISHHDLYCQAMLEVGADAKMIEAWVESVSVQGYRAAAEVCDVPTPALKFMNTTFDFIESDRPHVIAAAFCFGRETVLPRMFTLLAEQLDITRADCPKFHYYLDRHVALDGDSHGPASIEMVELLCDHDPVKIHEAEQAALRAIRARMTLWNDLAEVITQGRHRYYRSL